MLAAWGFSYKTVAFVWIKQNRKNDALFTGMGYWKMCIRDRRQFASTVKIFPWL